MKKRSALLLAALLSLALVGCAKEEVRVPTVGDVSETVLTENAPIVMEVTDETVARDAEKVALKVTNSSDETYSFGVNYELEVLSDGEWHKVTAAPRDYEICWTAEAYYAPAGGETDASAGLWVYGNLYKAGTYRVVKEFSPENGGGKVIAAAEFEIAE